MRIVGLTFRDEPSAPKESDITDLTVTQLKEYAAAHEIDLQGAQKKEDIIQRIQAALPEGQ